MKHLFQVIEKDFKNLNDLFKVCCDPLVKSKIVTNKYQASVLKRSKMASFFMGNGLIIPHSTEDGRKEIIGDGALLTTWFKKPIMFDGNKVHFSITIAVGAGNHMDVLQKIAMLFMDGEKIEALVKEGSEKKIRSYLDYA